MTHFAQLEKVALQTYGSADALNKARMVRMPNAGNAAGIAPAATNATQNATQNATDDEGWSWGDTGEFATDMVAGSNPYTGVPYYGAKALKDFSDGNIWSGIGNIGWGAASFAPLAGSALKGIGKGVMKLFGKGGAKAVSKVTAKAAPAIAKAQPLRNAVNNIPKSTQKALGWGGMTAGVIGGGADMLTGGDPQQQQQQQQPYNAQPQNWPFHGNQQGAYPAYNPYLRQGGRPQHWVSDRQSAADWVNQR